MFMPDGFLYDDPKKANKWMDGRKKLFEACRKSILSQEGDFEWIISLDKRTPNRYIQHIVCDSRIAIVHCDIRDALKEEPVETPWVITSRLDCDDQYLPGAVRAIQRKFRPRLRVIDFEYNELEWETGKLYSSRRHLSGSPFISLVEPSSRIKTAFCRPHGQVGGEYPMEGDWSTRWGNLTRINHVRLEEPFALMVCHGGNITNEIRGREITGPVVKTWEWEEE